MKLQHFNNTIWVDTTDEKVEGILRGCLKLEPYAAQREGRDQMTTTEEVANYLTTTGKELEYGTDWYQKVREADAAAARAAKRQAAEMVRCDCGHTTAKHMVMSASRGTSCPNCYDRMSD
jgi:predicted Zn-ribbon and HTH transcriptional regulator